MLTLIDDLVNVAAYAVQPYTPRSWQRYAVAASQKWVKAQSRRDLPRPETGGAVRFASTQKSAACTC